ncbi:hypothetical protein VM1G_11871 [Cytospora mali]|uniref:Uncharacterized protein n=1 Tax=Cytospora mali TaxID=578113 RepID=A0A194W9K7_CYTMA|nr:hypothetical protein VM1G_11871 [Valsa mali]
MRPQQEDRLPIELDMDLPYCYRGEPLDALVLLKRECTAGHQALGKVNAASSQTWTPSLACPAPAVR